MTAVPVVLGSTFAGLGGAAIVVVLLALAAFPLMLLGGLLTLRMAWALVRGLWHLVSR